MSNRKRPEMFTMISSLAFSYGHDFLLSNTLHWFLITFRSAMSYLVGIDICSVVSNIAFAVNFEGHRFLIESFMLGAAFVSGS